MFDSLQFEESISSFQKLLADGVFDNTISGLKLEDCRMLKRFVLCNLSKSKWVEHYNLLKVCTGDLKLITIGKILPSPTPSPNTLRERERGNNPRKN